MKGLFAFVLAGCLLMPAAQALAGEPASAAEAASAPELTLQQIYEMNRPAVVRVVTVHTLRVKSPVYKIDEKAYEKAYNDVYKMAVRGDITPTYEAVEMGVLVTMLNDPLTYYVVDEKADPLDEEVEITVQGTGFIINADGVAVTNAHVVKYDSEEVLDDIILQALYQKEQKTTEESFSDQIDRYISECNYGTGELNDLATEAVLAYYRRNLESTQFDTKIYVVPADAAGSQDWKEMSYEADVICAGDPVPGSDLAVLSFAGSGMPTVQLAESVSVKAGDGVAVISYPAAASDDECLSKEAAYVPTLTSGVISGEKKTADGYPIYQFSADISYGSSGGPVFNTEGKVVGIAAFGLDDGTGAGMISGMYFAYSTDALRTLMKGKSSGVQPAMNPLTISYCDAVLLMGENRYAEALEILSAVAAASSRYPYVQDMISRCNEQIKAGNNVTPTPEPTPEPTPKPTPTPRWAGVLPAGGEILAMQEMGVPTKAVVTIGLLCAGAMIVSAGIILFAVWGLILLSKRRGRKGEKERQADAPQDLAG
jgi:S1-C subfamily serine protease